MNTLAKKEKEKNNFKDYLQFLRSIFENNKSDNSEKLFSDILNDEFKKELDENNKKYILEIILGDKNLIKYNILLIMDIINSTIHLSNENNDVLADITSDEKYFPIFNKSKKIEKAIIKIFDIIIINYLESLKNQDILAPNLYNIFKNYLNVLGKEDYEYFYQEYDNENLLKLYAISFIKIYIIKYISIFYKNKNDLMVTENNINKEIICSNSLKNILYIFFIIVLYNKFKYNDEEYIKILEENFKDIYKFYNELKENIGEQKFDDILKTSKIPEEFNCNFW